MADPRRKLMRKRKKFGRCSVKGHGDNCYCEVCQEIQSQSFTRAEEKREVRKEIEDEIKDMDNEG